MSKPSPSGNCHLSTFHCEISALCSPNLTTVCSDFPRIPQPIRSLCGLRGRMLTKQDVANSRRGSEWRIICRSRVTAITTILRYNIVWKKQSQAFRGQDVLTLVISSFGKSLDHWLISCSVWNLHSASSLDQNLVKEQVWKFLHSSS